MSGQPQPTAPDTGALLPFGLVTVHGPSMAPTLLSGDVGVVHYRARVRPGRIVVAYRPDRPSLLVIKRVVRRDGAGWWLEGDNRFNSEDDSRTFGPVPPALVIGCWLFRCSPLRRTRRSRERLPNTNVRLGTRRS